MTEDMLHAKILVLEEENALLAEHAEDLLLLGSVAEEIDALEEEGAILETALERIAILKDLPLAGCYTLEPEPTPLALYSLWHQHPPQTSLEVDTRWWKTHPKGKAWLGRSTDAPIRLHLDAPANSLEHIILIPVGNQWCPAGLFMFASTGHSRRKLRAMLPLLERVSNMTARRMENLTLLRMQRAFNAQLEQRVAERTTALERSLQRLRTLHTLDEAILSAKSPSDVALTALERLRVLLSCQRISIAHFARERNEVHILGEWTAGTPPLVDGVRVPWEEYQVAPEVLQGQVHTVPDVQKMDAPPPVIRHLVGKKIFAYFNVPLIVEQRVIGALNVGYAQPEAFTQEHLDTAREVAATLAIAIHQARLRTEIEAYARTLEQRVAERTAELERMVALMAGREVRMAELKEVIRQLQEQLRDAGLTPCATDPLGTIETL